MTAKLCKYGAVSELKDGRATWQHGSAVWQQGSKAARQQGSKAARQQGSRIPSIPI